MSLRHRFVFKIRFSRRNEHTHTNKQTHKQTNTQTPYPISWLPVPLAVDIPLTFHSVFKNGIGIWQERFNCSRELARLNSFFLSFFLSFFGFNCHVAAGFFFFIPLQFLPCRWLWLRVPRDAFRILLFWNHLFATPPPSSLGPLQPPECSPLNGMNYLR